jgi:Rieske Fe-S protein
MKLPVLPAGGVSRRGFCAGSGAGLLVLGAGCSSGNPLWTTGPVDDQPPASTDMALPPRSPDLSQSGAQPDLAGADLANPTGASDLAQGGADLANPLPQDMAMGSGSCPSGLVPVTNSAGQPLTASAVAMGTATYMTDNATYEFFVCRDSGGLYAMSASCTHAGCTVKLQSNQFLCPCHFATFDYNGQNPTSPAFSPLTHYALCVNGASGSIFVNPNQAVTATTRV